MKQPLKQQQIKIRIKDVSINAALVAVAIFESQRRLNTGLFGFSLLQYGGFTFVALAVFLFVSIYPWIPRMDV